MAECLFCGKKYHKSWFNDGFCSGRCRKYAHQDGQTGNMSKASKVGCLVFVIGFLLLCAYGIIFGDATSSSPKSSTKSEDNIEEVIKEESNSRNTKRATNINEANEEPNETNASSVEEVNTGTETEENFVPIGGAPDPDPTTNESVSEEPTPQLVETE